jgi:uncharacterized SAM-binding protein YcdF (DUF218 family)
LTILFILKKLIVSAVIPPGILIIFCLCIAFFAGKRLRILLVLLAMFTYAVSIGPVSEKLMAPLEREYTQPTADEIKECDAYVVLGGGINTSAPTLDGRGMPEGDALFRVMAAYRLYLFSRKPIIISGGDYLGRESEAEVTARLLVSLGAGKDDLLLESRSTDTYENARYTREICKRYGFRKVLLITSAYHMKRSMMLFRKFVGNVTPYPTGHKTPVGIDFLHLLPDASSMVVTASALKEYMGILFYKITL